MREKECCGTPYFVNNRDGKETNRPLAVYWSLEEPEMTHGLKDCQPWVFNMKYTHFMGTSHIENPWLSDFLPMRFSYYEISANIWIKVSIIRVSFLPQIVHYQ